MPRLALGIDANCYLKFHMRNEKFLYKDDPHIEWLVVYFAIQELPESSNHLHIVHKYEDCRQH